MTTKVLETSNGLQIQGKTSTQKDIIIAPNSLRNFENQSFSPLNSVCGTTINCEMGFTINDHCI